MVVKFRVLYNVPVYRSVYGTYMYGTYMYYAEDRRSVLYGEGGADLQFREVILPKVIPRYGIQTLT